MKGKKWTQKQIDTLYKYWGVIGREECAKKCKKSVPACKGMAYRLGIGCSSDNHDGFNIVQLEEIVGVDRQNLYKTWIRGNGMKVSKVGTYVVVSESDLLDFMESHKHLWDARKCDYYYFYTNDWFLEKLEEERKLNHGATKVRQWTIYEERELMKLRNRGLSFQAIADEMGRTKASVYRKHSYLMGVS